MPIHKPIKQTPENLNEVAKEIDNAGAAIRGVAKAMKDGGFDALEVTNFDQLQRAIQYVGNFRHAVETALREAKRDRGDFGAGRCGGVDGNPIDKKPKGSNLNKRK